MSQFICAVATNGSGAPAAFALAEKQDTPTGSRYVVRDLETLGANAYSTLQARLASSREYAGHVVFVTDGGRKGATAAHDAVGMSAVPVEIVAGQSGGADALNVSPAELVDTFEGLYRAGAVEVSASDALVSSALSALYVHGDSDAGGVDDDRYDDEDIPTAASLDGPQSTVRQSGNAVGTSTAVVGDATAMAAKASLEGGRPAARADRGFSDVDLGEHRAPALALALATWYGEWSAESVPMTDQAARTARRNQVRNAARTRRRR